MSADADACKLIEYGSVVVCVARTINPGVFSRNKTKQQTITFAFLSVMKHTPLRVKFTVFV